MKRTRLNPMSSRRLVATNLYLYRIRQYLFLHPYCQVWLAENQVTEANAIRSGGVETLANGERATVPLATQVHHMNKRRGADLLDQRYWLAVCASSHRQVETDKAWARDRGYLMDF